MSATNEVTGTAKEQAGAVAQTTKEQAANVAGTAGQAAKDVAGTAKEQAATVATEAKERARDFVGETREQVRSQAGVQTQRLAQTVRSVAGELQDMASQSEQHGPATQVTRQIAERAHGVADYLEGTNPDRLLDDVRRFARQRTGLFLFGAGAAGFIAARLAKASSASKDSDDGGEWRPVTTERSYYGQPSIESPATTGLASPSAATSAMSGTAAGTYGDTGYAGTTGYGDAGYGEPAYGETTYAEPGFVEATAPGGHPEIPVEDYGTPTEGVSGIRPVDPLLDDERGQR